MTFKPAIVPLGDSTLLVQLGDQIDISINQRVHALAARIEVPVQYGGRYGVDLDFIANYHGLQVEDVIRIHNEKIYTVYMMGFTPGFPYMGKLDDAILTPRLETPRTRVHSGTVALAGSQTGIYPIDSPGGWRLIGYTSLCLFDPHSESPFLFAPGDEVKFIIEK
jgi:KipI family sensor histidine kinase inhibitor